MWRNRTVIGDWTQSWITPFVEFANLKQRIKAENLMLLSDNEKAGFLYSEVRQVRARNPASRQQDLLRSEIKRMTWYGIWYYGLQLTALELSVLGSVYMLKLVIDYLKTTIHL